MEKNGSAGGNRADIKIPELQRSGKGPSEAAKACFGSVIPLPEGVAVYVICPIEGERLGKEVSQPRSDEVR